MISTMEKSLSLVSVIVPLYNMEQYLQNCIDSIVNQTYSNIEIILVDDGSNDNSPQICDLCAKKDSRIHVVHKQNQGVGFARNTGIDIAKGEYIMFVDPDDYLPKNAIELFTERIKLDGSDMAIGQYVKVFDDGTQKQSEYYWFYDSVLETDEALELFGSEKTPFPLVAWAKIYKSVIFKDLRFTSLLAGEDVEIMPKIISASKKISILSEVVYCYYQRNSSVTHRKTDTIRMDCLKAALSVGRFLLDRELMEPAKNYYRGAVIIVADMHNKKPGRNLLKKTYSKTDLKLFRNKGTVFYIAWIGMYIPYFFKNTMSFLKLLKKAVKKFIHKK